MHFASMLSLKPLRGAGRRFLKLAMPVLMFGFGVGTAPAWAGAQDPASNGEIRPAALYHNYCSVCHGDKGDGRSRAQGSLNPPPRDFTTPEAVTLLTRERMLNGVLHGRPGTAMIGWKSQLNQKEIEAVVDYIRNTFMPASSAADANRGRGVYSKNCSVCHGEKGDGRSRAQASLMPPPRDFTSPAAKTELTQQRMINSVTYGRPDTAMAGFKSQLSKEDINAVVEYIRGGFMGSGKNDGISGIRHGRRPMAPEGADAAAHASAPALPAAMPVKAAPAVNLALPMPKALSGDTVKGGAFYMANCATCHGATGDGRGPRAYFINPKPRNFLHPASRQEFNRPALFNVISSGKRGTEMPAWDKVLTQQEIADVAEFVFQRFIQPKDANTKQGKAIQK